MINKSEHYNNLLDFYESLLTEKQKLIKLIQEVS